jgi:hypothetical protein
VNGDDALASGARPLFMSKTSSVGLVTDKEVGPGHSLTPATKQASRLSVQTNPITQLRYLILII